MKTLVLSLLLLGGALAVEEKNLVSADLNDYIDTITPALREWIDEHMNPMSIPDLCDDFSVRPLLIEYHGQLYLTDGWLTGLTSLSRTGDFIVTYINRLLRVRGDFGFTDMRFTYDYLAKVMNIGPTGGVIGTVSRVSGVMDMLIDFNNYELHLQDFYLHDVGRITIRFTGNILVDWLANAMTGVITTLFKNVIVRVIENNLRDAIQEKLDEINNNISGSAAFVAEYPHLHGEVLRGLRALEAEAPVRVLAELDSPVPVPAPAEAQPPTIVGADFRR